MSFGIQAGHCHTDLYTAGPPVPVLDTATGSLGPGQPQLGIGPGLSQSPGHSHSHNLAGMDSKQPSLSGSTLLQNKYLCLMSFQLQNTRFTILNKK